MKNLTKYSLFIIHCSLLIVNLLSCEAMATLFHGQKPEDPPVMYTVTFNANGATGTAPETQTVETGTHISLPGRGSLSKGADIFAGWNESSGGNGTGYSAGASVAITRNMVFYAQWLDSSTPQYTVTFNPNGATGGAAPAAQTVYSGISITVPDRGTLAYSGKVFGGWNTQSNGGGTNYAAGATFTVSGNATLYAKWDSEVQYTVTYHANGGSGTAPTAQRVDPGTEITLPGSGNLVYTGRKFDGWNTQSNGAGTDYAAGAKYTVNGNATLYAKWLEQYTVTFHANGASGSPPAAQSADQGTVISLPGVTSMAYTGRIFKGWNTQANGSGTGYAEGVVYTVTANSTLYAMWESVPVTPPGSTLVQQLAYVANQTGDGDVFDIVVQNNVTMGPATVASMGRNITVIIRSASPADAKTIQLDGQGHLFSVDTGITLKLQDIVLKGHSTNNRALVAVSSGCTLILNSGAIITQNTNYKQGLGGGIYVDGGTIELNEGSEISENELKGEDIYYPTFGGGIYVTNRGNVNIRGGIISANKLTNHWYAGATGGGISIYGNSTVNMSGGIISKNIISSGHGQYGGGIFVDNGSTFIKRAGLGNNTSGIIYGGSVGDANITNGSGSVIYRNWGTLRNRNTTLGGYDEISTGNDVGWE